MRRNKFYQMPPKKRPKLFLALLPNLLSPINSANSPLKKREGNWTEFTFAKTFGTVTRDREKIGQQLTVSSPKIIPETIARRISVPVPFSCFMWRMANERHSANWFPFIHVKTKKARKAVWANFGGMAFVKVIDFRSRFAVNVLQWELWWQCFSRINPQIKGYDSILLLVSLLCMCSWKLFHRLDVTITSDYPFR